MSIFVKFIFDVRVTENCCVFLANYVPKCKRSWGPYGPILIYYFCRLCGSPPFQSKDEDGLYEIIKTADVTNLYADKPIWQSISDEGEYKYYHCKELVYTLGSKPKGSNKCLTISAMAEYINKDKF